MEFKKLWMEIIKINKQTKNLNSNKPLNKKKKKITKKRKTNNNNHNNKNNSNKFNNNRCPI
jgi:hypothetical protein